MLSFLTLYLDTGYSVKPRVDAVSGLIDCLCLLALKLSILLDPRVVREDLFKLYFRTLMLGRSFYSCE